MRKLYSLLLVVLLATSAFAQSTITGKVTDSKGDGLPGVSIALKGTSTGVISDADGNYSISAPFDGALVFSFIGFKTAEVKVGGRTSINVTLEEDLTALEEVVVIGYGEQKKSLNTAAISRVDSKQLSNFSNQRLEQMLQGQVAGVTIKPSSGQPGSGFNILIRGIGTNGDNSPLIIIDGMSANDGALSALNPEDIESIEIMKDAASTAIYGARGANGVVFVKTKKAKAGEASLVYEGFYGMQRPWSMPKVLNASQYVELISEKYANSGLSLPAGFPTQETIPHNSDWINKLVQAAPTQRHGISLSKGTENGSINASLSYFAQDGIIAPKKSNARRVTGRFAAEQKVNDLFFFGQSAQFVHATNERIGENNVFGSPLSEALVYDPLTPYYDPNGTFGFAQSPYVQKEYLNPLSQIFITNNSSMQNGIIGNTFLKITPVKGLVINTSMGIDYQYYTGKGFTPSYKFYDTNGNQLNLVNELNDIYEYSSKNFIWQWENFATYTKDFGKHSIQGTIGTTMRQFKGSSFGASSSGIPEEVQFDPNFQYIDNTPDSLRRSNSSAPEKVSLVSVFGRAIYGYDQKYLVTATLRRDGSSVFGPNNRYGIFPSVSLGWVVSREAFWNFETVNFLKAKLSYGVNGNDRIGTLRYASVIGNTGSYPFGKPGSQTIYNGLSSLFADNPDIKWEESKQFDAGFEVGLLNDRITLEMDYYIKKTSGLLMEATTLDLDGFNGPPIANVGEVVNRGFEFEAKYRQNFGQVNFGASLNVTTLHNEVTKVTDNGYIDGYTWPVRNTVITRMEVGKPIGFFRGYKTAGIFNSQDEVFSHINSSGQRLQPNAQAGDIKFVDVNKDGVIDSKDITEIGSPWAKAQIGLNLNASYKGFDIRLLFTSSVGNDIYRSYERQDVINNNYTTEWLDRWTPENPTASYPRLTVSDPNNNSRASDFYVENGSYVRLKSLQIGYSLPSSILEKIKVTKMRAYVTFDNLWTLTGYSGFDPEIGNSGWILDTGIDKGFYPQLKTMGFGLRVQF
ncbi:MAG: TonB-dependent receptor [Cyclobacteriaceae bacterium]|nr:TonB-dependent receptor [Cyclobacteriaceae bacterium]